MMAGNLVAFVLIHPQLAGEKGFGFNVVGELQNQFFQDQAKMRQKGDEEASEPDDDYVRVLEFGLPAAGGLGIGIDRLAMFLTDAHHIRQVVLFPVIRKNQKLSGRLAILSCRLSMRSPRATQSPNR